MRIETLVVLMKKEVAFHNETQLKINEMLLRAGDDDKINR